MVMTIKSDNNIHNLTYIHTGTHFRVIIHLTTYSYKHNMWGGRDRQATSAAPHHNAGIVIILKVDELAMRNLGKGLGWLEAGILWFGDRDCLQ